MTDLTRSTTPRPWYPDADLTPLARARYPQRHASARNWREWLNVADEVRAELSGGAQYPADVVGMVNRADQLPLAFDKAA